MVERIYFTQVRSITGLKKRTARKYDVNIVGYKMRRPDKQGGALLTN
jgi:hypothetical protein